MKRFIIALVAVALCAAVFSPAAEAGPLRNLVARAAENRQARQANRQSNRQAGGGILRGGACGPGGCGR